MRPESRRISGELCRGFLAFLIAVALMIGLGVATRGRVSNRIASMIGAATIAIYYFATLRWIERR